MKKLNLMIVSAVLLLSSSLVVNTAYGTKGWVRELTPWEANPTANHGKVKICGDHICKPFEYNKILRQIYDAHKNKTTSTLKTTKKQN